MPARSLAHSNSSLRGDDTAGQMHYYLGPRPTGSRIKAWLWRNLTPRGLLERLLRSTIQKNTWIYVSVSDLLVNCKCHQLNYSRQQDKHCELVDRFLATEVLMCSF